MEDDLRAAGLRPPTPLRKFAEVQAMHLAYEGVKSHSAWIDLMSRVEQYRQLTITQLVNGTLDKFGNEHDDERRAVLLGLERILAFPRMIARDYETLRKRQEQLEKRATIDGIHGDDPFNVGGGYESSLTDRTYWTPKH